MNTRNSWRVWGVLAMTFMLVAACHPKEGTPCDLSSPLQCKGKEHAMVCLTGRWAEFNCFGERGCYIDGPQQLVVCDQSNAHEGDFCSTGYISTGDAACSLDEEQDILQCDDEVFVHYITCPEDTVCTHLDDYYLGCE